MDEGSWMSGCRRPENVGCEPGKCHQQDGRELSLSLCGLWWTMLVLDVILPCGAWTWLHSPVPSLVLSGPVRETELTLEKKLISTSSLQEALACHQGHFCFSQLCISS